MPGRRLVVIDIAREPDSRDVEKSVPPPAAYVTPPIYRDPFRNVRRRSVAGETVSMRTMKRELEAGRIEYPEEVERPKTRAECKEGERPCPFVGCKFNLYLDVSETTGSIKLNFPDIEPDEMKHSCVLDITDAGSLTLESTGNVLNLTRERVRQIVVKATEKLGVSDDLEKLTTGGYSSLGDFVADERRKKGVDSDRETEGVPEPVDDEDD